MRKIDKQTPLTDFSKFVSKNHPTRWEELPPAISSESRFCILCNEQDCLCGYSEIILEESPASSHIDHYYKRDLFPKKTYDWNNLIVSTIDEDFGGKYKDNIYKIGKGEYAQIFNPVVDDMSQFIEFSGNGEIVPLKGLEVSTISKIKKTIEVFNLNCISLRSRRKNLISQLNDCKDLPKEDLIKAFGSYGFISVVKWFLNTL
ncbi:retron system putative HNH endonuclease [Tannerella forsythia]|uniref:retron system putative HNH endonuclease n=1 Tax=Tannerella forsythia TaxID=28112 RepID=UPI000BE70118|nr:retron system putative HNH endonuclease [Tannerella forsythia]PDP71693.1 TIGR02646 family protein [Tannerella forsythia]